MLPAKSSAVVLAAAVVSQIVLYMASGWEDWHGGKVEGREGGWGREGGGEGGWTGGGRVDWWREGGLGREGGGGGRVDRGGRVNRGRVGGGGGLVEG